MKNSFHVLLLLLFLTSCQQQNVNRTAVVKSYYSAFDSGDYNALKAITNDSVTIISGDFTTNYDKEAFYEFYKWDSIFKPTYNTIKIEEENNTVLVTVAQKNKRNSFLQNNPLKFKVRVSFTSGKISKLEELEYINVNWNEWNQQKNALVEWVQLNHPELDGFVNDMTMKGAMDYLKAIELYEKKELLN
ncbi:hypothetical protein [Maribacter dokdonensis]|uniref:hypothetical protein n=1 Tax=Maribacter dokdonensis TaxID=320912 RepID=UPI0032981820